jgi:hypothetical protein
LVVFGWCVCCVRFGFGEASVQVVSSGDPVSFYTTQQHQHQDLLGRGKALSPAFVVASHPHKKS